MLNPKKLIDEKPMTLLQYTTVFICFLMNMLDGMDVMVISYTAPAIAKSWSISPQALGVVFSSGLVGMTVGTLFIAPFADRIGRKSILLLSGLIMGVCIYLTAFSTSITELLIYRFVSGLGIGSMLASTASLTAEYTPNKTRNFYVSFVLAGYPVGAVLSGMVAAKVIPTAGWEQMFRIAGYASFASVPLIYLFLSESIDFYLRTQPANALAKLNKILVKINSQPISHLPEINKKITSKLPVGELLHSDYRKATFQLWIALFMAFAAMYFLVSWIPKLASDAGLSMDLAIYAGTIFNVGAFFGIVTQGYFSTKFGLKKTLSVFLLLTGVLMASFGLFIGTNWLLLIIALLGFGIQGGFVGLYAVAARMYPTEFRTTGVGWSMGAGRLGGIIGPIFGGILIGAGLGISANFIVFAIPSIIAGWVTARLSSKEIN